VRIWELEDNIRRVGGVYECVWSVFVNWKTIAEELELYICVLERVCWSISYQTQLTLSVPTVCAVVLGYSKGKLEDNIRRMGGVYECVWSVFVNWKTIAEELGAV